jgi:hypothetical protein
VTGPRLNESRRALKGYPMRCAIKFVSGCAAVPITILFAAATVDCSRADTVTACSVDHFCYCIDAGLKQQIDDRISRRDLGGPSYPIRPHRRSGEYSAPDAVLITGIQALLAASYDLRGAHHLNMLQNSDGAVRESGRSGRSQGVGKG